MRDEKKRSESSAMAQRILPAPSAMDKMIGVSRVAKHRQIDVETLARDFNKQLIMLDCFCPIVASYLGPTS